MPSPSTGRSPSPANAATGRSPSLLSRFKTPFAAKARHIGEFFVQPDDPHRQYGPGDVITGSVILKILKPLRVTHITICLHGFVQVYRAANAKGDGYQSYTGTSVPGKTMRTGYFGNGFISLFVDEVALCGEGRLGEGTYQFGFELVFPKDRQPSSISFERGTIAYMITCTLTKPTTIAPTVMKDREVKYGEDIDIAKLLQPQPRVITLEPQNKRGRSRQKARRRAEAGTGADGEQRASGSLAGSEGTITQRGSATTISQPGGETAMSPVPSEISFDSALSSAETGSARDSVTQSAFSSGSGRRSSSTQSNQQPISTSIEISRAGFMRGDTIQVRISIQHRKVVRSLHGVIITFYRQARVDMHPALPIVGKDGEERKAEEYYPKSKTGLGGLSLSAAGSSHVFRKDLSQSFASLIVNPDTLTADIKATVRVPEEAFPSIASVPGNMISFKYYVEVLLDIQGKLTGLDRLFPSVGNQYGPGAGMNAADGTSSGMMSAWGGHFIDTQDIRREKSVISSLFEVVIGTRDSERTQNLSTRTTPAVARATPESAPTQAGAGDEVQAQMYPTEEPAPYDYDSRTHYDEQWYYENYGYHNDLENGHHDRLYDTPYSQAPPLTPSVPLPDLTEENELPEKERMRRAEARLLPSQPPGANEAESSTVAERFAPSAPAMNLPSHSSAGTSNGTTARRDTAEYGGQEHLDSGSSVAPAYSGPSHPVRIPNDDKQELQRQRLEMERSAPDDDNPAEEDGIGERLRSTGSDPGHGDLPPSAPVLDDDDDDHLVGTSFSPLPKYER